MNVLILVELFNSQKNADFTNNIVNGNFKEYKVVIFPTILDISSKRILKVTILGQSDIIHFNHNSAFNMEIVSVFSKFRM